MKKIFILFSAWLRLRCFTSGKRTSSFSSQLTHLPLSKVHWTFFISTMVCALGMMTACKSGGEPADIDTTPALDNIDSRCSLCERFPEYDDCGDVFHNGYTWVSKGELLGIADSNGNLLTPIKWDMVLVIDNHDMLVESGGKTYIIDALGNLTETGEKIDWSGEAYD